MIMNALSTVPHSTCACVCYQIDRIQNRTLYQQYAAKKVHLEKQNAGIENEKTLWHGTASDAVENINNYGFNRSYCGKNGECNVCKLLFAVLTI